MYDCHIWSTGSHAGVKIDLLTIGSPLLRGDGC